MNVAKKQFVEGMAMNNIGEVFSYITERGILSGFYIGIITFGIVVSDNTIRLPDGSLPWVLLICTILGLN